MKATVKNLRPELKAYLLANGYNEDDRIDINELDEIANKLGLSQVQVEGFSKVGELHQRNEDGTPHRS